MLLLLSAVFTIACGVLLQLLFQFVSGY
jgi:hypothetical protein